MLKALTQEECFGVIDLIVEVEPIHAPSQPQTRLIGAARPIRRERPYGASLTFIKLGFSSNH